jgi:hypothetical protein
MPLELLPLATQRFDEGEIKGSVTGYESGRGIGCTPFNARIPKIHAA